MSKKTHYIITVCMFIFSMLVIGDLISFQLNYAKLISNSVIINNEIDSQGGITDEIQEYVLTNLKSKISCISACDGDSGDIIRYQLSIENNPFIWFVWILGDNRITITRSMMLS